MSKLGISSLFKTILLTAALAVSFTASAFTEGTDYMVLEKPIPNADSYVRLSIIDVQLRTSEHRSMYSYVRLSIDRCTLRNV